MKLWGEHPRYLLERPLPVPEIHATPIAARALDGAPILGKPVEKKIILDVDCVQKCYHDQSTRRRMRLCIIMIHSTRHKTNSTISRNLSGIESSSLTMNAGRKQFASRT